MAGFTRPTISSFGPAQVVPRSKPPTVTLPPPGEDDGFGGGSGPVIRNFPDGSIRALRPGGAASNPNDWVTVGEAPAGKQPPAPEIEYDAQGRAFVWTTLNGVPVTRMLGPQFDNPTKAAGYRAPAAPRAPFIQPARNEFGGVDAVIYDPYTFTEIARVPSAEWADLSPQEKQRNLDAAAERANAAAFARQAASDVAAGQRTGMQEASALQRAQLSEQGAGQRAELSARTTGFESVNRLAPQLGDLALRGAEFTRDVLRSPSDAVARMAFTRGSASGLPMVSQADILNQLRQNQAQFNEALQGFGKFNPALNTAGFAVPTAAPSVAPSNTPANMPVAPPPPAIGSPAWIDAAKAAGFTQAPPPPPAIGSPAWIDAAKAAGFVQQAPEMANGGFTNSNMVMTGDPKPGTDKPNEELVIDIPEEMGGGLMVIPKNRLIGRRRRTANTAPKAANGGVFGSNPFGFSTIPQQGGISQDQIRAWELQTRAPAVNSLLTGVRPAEMQIGFNLPTPMGYGALTQDERSAFGTTLAAMGPEAPIPSDVEQAIRERFSTGRRGRAAMVGF